ncbi:unnamed protein product [Adineta ricciae]|uniref:Uncharacterized protein n=1 Tax=Adineta ricciae TaxID=249248 RepID=A0A814WSH6_ADIRI|nr:unnamed protein product [Adineta ricciae]CAF1393502.1 unnamed protein product [Adineta ricciae]
MRIHRECRNYSSENHVRDVFGKVDNVVQTEPTEPDALSTMVNTTNPKLATVTPTTAYSNIGSPTKRQRTLPGILLDSTILSPNDDMIEMPFFKLPF